MLRIIFPLILTIGLMSKSYPQSNPAVIFGSGGYGSILPANGLEFKSKLKLTDKDNYVEADSLRVQSTKGNTTALAVYSSDGTLGLLNVGDNLLSFGQDSIHTNTGYTKLPTGTTLQRPVTPVEGMIRYNSTLGEFEGFTDEWTNLGGDKLPGGSIKLEPIENDPTIFSASRSVSYNMESFRLDQPSQGVSGAFIIPENFDTSKHIIMLNVPMIERSSGVFTLTHSFVVKKRNSTTEYTYTDHYLVDAAGTNGKYLMYQFPTDLFTMAAGDLVSFKVFSRIVSSQFTGQLDIINSAFISMEKK